MKKFKVGPEYAGTRADVFVSSKYPQFTRSSFEGLFHSSKVTIGKKTVKASYKTREGDLLEVDDSLLLKKPAKIDLSVIYEDENLLVIDKPAGILTHSKGVLNLESTVASFIRPKIDKELAGNRAGIVHRLDRGTSGVIIAAKTQQALKYLQKQFSERKTKKTYLAIVEGIPQPDEAIIDAPIARNPKKPQTFKVSSDGRSARTKYKVLKELKGSALLEITPETGRTHQIRVHLAYIDHPVIGDHIYGRGGNGMLLHAQKLEIKLPGGVDKEFTAPVPESFKGAEK